MLKNINHLSFWSETVKNLEVDTIYYQTYKAAVTAF